MKGSQLHFTKMVLYHLVLSSGHYETIMKLPFPHFPLIYKMLQLGILGCEQALPGVSPHGQGALEGATWDTPAFNS